MALNKKNLISDLKNLISIPSYEGEGLIAHYIIKELEKEGLSPLMDKFGNVILVLGEGEGFLLNAHMDTVAISGWEGSGLKPIIKGGRLFGRGSSDTKSGIATMIEIARNLKNKKLKRKVIFLFSVKEEDSTLETNGAYLASKRIDAKEAIVFEPTFKGKNLNIGIGCRGAYRFHIIVKGKSGHSSAPDRGVNALYLTNDFITDFRQMKKKEKEYNIMEKKVRLSSVFSVTQVKAEEGTNVIPGRCSFSIDYRSLPDENPISIRNSIQILCKKHFKEGFLTKEYFIPGYLDYSRPFLNLVKKISLQYGYAARFIIRAGRNDASIFSNYANISSICFGTGESKKGHIVQESVLIRGFLDCSEIIYKIVSEVSVND
jgi:acetylornithine deacetylase/succinyl-diaminopimelate desuccinylase-like protein